MTLSLRFLALAWMLCHALGAGAAQQDKISSDRPDFLTDPDVIGKGRFQIEAGALLQRDDADNRRTRTVATPTLLRLGLTDSLELLLETDGRMRTRETDLATQATVREQGWADASLGIKWNSHKSARGSGAPAIGWVFEAEMPTGSRAFRGRGVRPSVLGAFQWGWANQIDLSVNAGVKYDDDETEGRFWAGTLGAGVSKGLTERLKVMTEVVALQLAGRRYGGNVVVADVAVTYLLTPTLEIDALVGRGLTGESPRYVVTTGFSARF